MDNDKIQRVHGDGYIAIYYDDVYVGKTYIDTSRYFEVVTEIRIMIPDNTEKGVVSALTDIGCVIDHYEEQDIVAMHRTFYDDEYKAIAWWYEIRQVLKRFR
jgi:hypothetical protein